MKGAPTQEQVIEKALAICEQRGVEAAPIEAAHSLKDEVEYLVDQMYGIFAHKAGALPVMNLREEVCEKPMVLGAVEPLPPPTITEAYPGYVVLKTLATSGTERKQANAPRMIALVEAVHRALCETFKAAA